MFEYIPFSTIYTHSHLLKDLSLIKKEFPFVKISSIGKSVLKKDIPFLKIGNGKKQVLYCASFHANEWITTPILINFVNHYLSSYINNSNIYGYQAKKLFNNSSLYVVPMVNPDGVNLVTGGLSNTSSEFQKAKKISLNYPSIPFPAGWKSNICGVDLKTYQPSRKAL